MISYFAVQNGVYARFCAFKSENVRRPLPVSYTHLGPPYPPWVGGPCGPQPIYPLSDFQSQPFPLSADGEAPDAKNPEWSGPLRIGDGVMLNKPTVLQNGDWLLPISLWKAVTSEYNPSCPNRLANVYRSSDGGKSFHYLSGVDMPDRYYDEHMLVERTDGSLWMLLRLQTGLGEAFSADGGKTWHSIEKSGIWGPNARFFIRRLRSGRLLLVNHAREPGTAASGTDAFGAISKANISGADMPAGKRNRLAAFLSDDEGKTWSTPLILDEREDVSYPDGVEREDGLIELIYDYSRFAQKEILMAKFREEDILAGRMVSADGKLRILVDKAGE